jgi:hypothetical protein
MEGTGPDAVARWLNAHAVCTGWTPWSEWISVPAVGLRNWIAIPRALVTSAAVGVVSIDQSTTLCGSPFPPGSPPTVDGEVYAFSCWQPPTCNF